MKCIFQIWNPQSLVSLFKVVWVSVSLVHLSADAWFSNSVCCPYLPISHYLLSFSFFFFIIIILNHLHTGAPSTGFNLLDDNFKNWSFFCIRLAKRKNVEQDLQIVLRGCFLNMQDTGLKLPLFGLHNWYLLSHFQVSGVSVVCFFIQFFPVSLFKIC